MYDVTQSEPLPHARGRELVARAVDKAEQLQLSGAIVVTGASGALITASRMDHGGAGGLNRARSKSWISATQQIPSAEHLARMNFVSRPVAEGFVAASPEALFPGAGGMPIRDGGVVVGGIAASGATVSPFFPAGVDPENLIVGGRPANPEDLLIHYALGIDYVGQHGDDMERWLRRYGAWEEPVTPGKGMAPAPRASAQAELDRAIEVADRAIRAAHERGLAIAVAVVDRRGEPVQLDAMDGAPAAAVHIAEATAAGASVLRRPSEELAPCFGDEFDAVRALLPVTVLAVAGGVPLPGGGAVGIGGADPAVCGAIAAVVSR